MPIAQYIASLKLSSVDKPESLKNFVRKGELHVSEELNENITRGDMILEMESCSSYKLNK